MIPQQIPLLNNLVLDNPLNFLLKITFKFHSYISWWLWIENPPANAGDTVHSLVRQFPHDAEQLSLSIRSWCFSWEAVQSLCLEPISCNCRAHVLHGPSPVPRAYGPQQPEKPLQWEAHTTRKSSPRSPQLEKTVLQRRASTATRNT